MVVKTVMILNILAEIFPADFITAPRNSKKNVDIINDITFFPGTNVQLQDSPHLNVLEQNTAIYGGEGDYVCDNEYSSAQRLTT